MDFPSLLNRFGDCPCGQKHECAIRDIRIGSGMTAAVGEILSQNRFPKKLLLVADRTTFAVSDGILDALREFDVTCDIYDSLRVATMNEVRRVEAHIDAGCEAVLAVGTGSIHDPCRLACANKHVPLCLFATAPSMDGFASYSAPIVDGNFKTTYPAKCPEVIIADTRILAEAPSELKSAGFGDMVSKYIALIDWQVSHLISGEPYCAQVAGLTRYAADTVMSMADRITARDEASAAAVFEGLLLTGIAMSFTKTSRPGSGCEHIMAHYMECKELLEGKIPGYHGAEVGVATLTVLKLYESLLSVDTLHPRREICDWDDIRHTYGALAPEMMKLNTPDTITDGIDPARVTDKFDAIKKIITSVPSFADVRAAMVTAGCRMTYQDIGKSEDFYREAFLYHPYMRRRLSLRRLLNLTDYADRLPDFDLS